MLITAIRDYLLSAGQANLQDLSRHFKVQESAMEHMLTFWLRKGTIRQLNINDNTCNQKKCSDCLACPDGVKKIYTATTPTQEKTIPIHPEKKPNNHNH